MSRPIRGVVTANAPTTGSRQPGQQGQRSRPDRRGSRDQPRPSARLSRRRRAPRRRGASWVASRNAAPGRPSGGDGAHDGRPGDPVLADRRFVEQQARRARSSARRPPSAAVARRPRGGTGWHHQRQPSPSASRSAVRAALAGPSGIPAAGARGDHDLVAHRLRDDAVLGRTAAPRQAGAARSRDRHRPADGLAWSPALAPTHTSPRWVAARPASSDTRLDFPAPLAPVTASARPASQRRRPPRGGPRSGRATAGQPVGPVQRDLPLRGPARHPAWRTRATPVAVDREERRGRAAPAPRRPAWRAHSRSPGEHTSRARRRRRCGRRCPAPRAGRRSRATARGGARRSRRWDATRRRGGRTHRSDRRAAPRGIEHRRRLVEKQHPAAEHQAAGERQALALAPGQRRRRVPLRVGEAGLRLGRREPCGQISAGGTPWFSRPNATSRPTVSATIPASGSCNSSAGRSVRLLDRRYRRRAPHPSARRARRSAAARRSRAAASTCPTRWAR